MRYIGLIGAAALLWGCPGLAQAKAPDCAGLKQIKLKDVRIETAEALPGGTRWSYPPSPFNMMAGPNPGTQAAFCRVAGVIEKEIRFELWLPPEWNDRFEGVGNGGLTGGINYPAMAAGLGRGFAVASTDTGHVTPDNFFDDSWVPGHPDRVENFGHRAHHLMAVTGKAITAAYYGKAPYKSYYDGCSSGGWQGLTEAQKYPADYDGIVAGAPANNFVRLQTRYFWTDALSRADPAGDLSEAHVQLIIKAAYAQCDPADGVADGIISHPRQCAFDPAQLLCKPGQSSDCLTQPQIDRAHKLFGPAKSAGGIDLYPGNQYGAVDRIAIQGVEPMILKVLPEGERDWTPATFDPDRDLAPLDARLGSMLSAWQTDLSAFRKRGGKLITYHGWTDPLLSPWNSIGYHARVEVTMAKLDEPVDDFYRLFMVPGMDHCRGGPGTDNFDALGAVIDWVEQGRAPARITATGWRKNGAPRTRPLCPFPQVATYTGSGSSDDAANFACTGTE